MRPLAFDIGNVLVEVNFSPFEKCWRKFNLHLEEHYMDFLLDLHGQQDVGLTTIRRHVKERFGHLLKQQGINLALYELDRAWDEIIIPNELMIGFMNDLRDEGHPIALWSNMGTEHADFMNEAFPEIFEGKISHLSCEVGVRKPAKLYYQSFLLDHHDFNDCIYLDDLPQNIKRAKEYRLNAIHFELDKELENGTLLNSLQKIRSML